MAIKKFYIAGPVSKQPDGNYAAFKQVADQITESGHIALYTSLLPQGMSEKEYMKFAHAMLEVCDVVVLLHRWGMSDGAVAEYHWAVKLEKPTILSDHLPKILRWSTTLDYFDKLVQIASNEVKNRIDGNGSSQFFESYLNRLESRHVKKNEPNPFEFCFNEIKSLDWDDVKESMEEAKATGSVHNRLNMIINFGKSLERQLPENSHDA